LVGVGVERLFSTPPLDAAPRRLIHATHADGPPLARTGGFGEPTCQQCHQGNALNQTPGGVTIAGLPDRYQPNHSYELTAVLTRPEMRIAGFQLSVRTHDRRGRQAGELASGDERTNMPLPSFAPVQYLQHSRRGAGLTAQDTAQWRFTWHAPEGFGPVVFHVAANAGNADNSPLDDFIYMREFVLQPRP
jgi:hypothetical protein